MNRTLEISTNKLKVELVDSNWKQGKQDVKVTLTNGSQSFFPSFADLFRIIESICDREDERYPTGKGRNMVGEFLKDATEKGMTFERLVYKYNLPITNDIGERLLPWSELGRDECMRRAFGVGDQYEFEWLNKSMNAKMNEDY